MSDATSEVGKGHLIMYNLINASEAVQRCNKVVAALHVQVEQQESWNLLSLNRGGFNKKIHYDKILAPTTEAFHKTDIRRKRYIDYINEVWAD